MAHICATGSLWVKHVRALSLPTTCEDKTHVPPKGLPLDCIYCTIHIKKEDIQINI